MVLESTTYPGTTEELLAGILADGSGPGAGTRLLPGLQPRRIDPGNRQFSFAEIPKVVSGINGVSLDAVQAFYETLVRKTIAVSRPREAELAKLIENTFRTSTSPW